MSKKGLLAFSLGAAAAVGVMQLQKKGYIDLNRAAARAAEAAGKLLQKGEGILDTILQAGEAAPCSEPTGACIEEAAWIDLREQEPTPVAVEPAAPECCCEDAAAPDVAEGQEAPDQQGASEEF